MVTVQVINHSGCHQGLLVLGESLNTHQILDASKANVNQCCKNRKGCTQSDFGATFYPFEECFSTWLNDKWSRESCHLSGSGGTRWSQPVCLHDWSGLCYIQVWLRSRQCLPLALRQGTPTAFIPTLCADRSPWDFYFQIFFVTSEVLWFNPTGSHVPCNHWLSPPSLVHPKQSTVLRRRENLYPSQNQTKREDKYWWFLDTCYFVELKMRFHYRSVSKRLSDLCLKTHLVTLSHLHICDW